MALEVVEVAEEVLVAGAMVVVVKGSAGLEMVVDSASVVLVGWAVGVEMRAVEGGTHVCRHCLHIIEPRGRSKSTAAGESLAAKIRAAHRISGM